MFPLCLIVYTVAFVCASDSVAENRPKRNVLFIVVDDLRPALQIYGDKKAITPNIDRLAAGGFVFSNAYAQQALCAPSRNSMLTSRRPDTLRLYDFYSYWRTSVGNFTTLPQYFKSNGYDTISLGKVFHPGPSSNYTDDFPLSWTTLPYHSASERFINTAVCTNVNTGQLQKNVICPVQVRFQPMETLPDIETVRKAKEILRNQNNSTKPMFIAVGIHKPHIPLRFPAQYLNLHQLDKFEQPNFNYVPHDLPSVAFNPYSDIRIRADVRELNVSFPFGPMPHSFGVRMRQAFYAAVSYVDDLIGDLLSVVDLKQTIVVLTSDHGWSLGEHAEWAKYSNFEVALRVPLIISDPLLRERAPAAYQPPNRHNRRENIVELLDIFPTIVDLAGLAPLKMCVPDSMENTCVEGRSLLPLLRKPEPLNSSVAYSQYPRPSDYPQLNSDRPKLAHIKIMGYSMRTHQYRYTIWIRFNHISFERDWKHVFGEELYDHYLDPSENLNLVSRTELDGVRLKLKRQLKKQFP